MYVYQSYCYESLSDIADQFLSDPLVIPGFFIAEATFPGGDNIVLSLQELSTGDLQALSHSPPLCSSLGFVNSYSGLTISDAQELYGWGLLILVGTFVVNAMRRGL